LLLEIMNMQIQQEVILVLEPFKITLVQQTKNNKKTK
jgi:hypothetical protein